MNNTSAYANVLLKSPALKTAAVIPAAVTPKYDYVNDDSSANFRQTFKDVHENQKSLDDKVHKPASHKKSTQVGHHSDTKNNREIKDVKPTKETAAQQKPTDDSADINRNTMGSEVVSEQPVQHKNNDLYADQNVTNLVVDMNSDATQLVLGTAFTTATEASVPAVADVSVSVDEQILTQETSVSANRNAASIPVDSVSPLSPLFTKSAAVSAVDGVDPVPLTGNSIASEIIDSGSPVSLLPPKPELGVVPMAPVESNTPSLETESLLDASQSPNTSVKIDDDSDGVIRSLVVDESLLQQSIDNSQTVSENQLVNTVAPLDAPALAAGAMNSLLAVKPTQGTVSNDPEKAAEILAVLMPETNLSAKQTAKASAPIDATLDASNPVTTTQVQMQAAKSAFEKTLQTIVSPDASGADDSAAPALSSSSSTTTFMDSLMRSADQQTPAARSFVVQTAVPVPVGQPQWSQAVSEKVLWLAAQNVSSAEINLHPKDLGPIQVKVSVNQEQATVSFTSQHAVVREVLDQSLNRLRDMFSEQGLNLVNVDVSDKSFSRQQGDAQDRKAQGGSNDVAQEEETPIAMSAIVQQRLVDHYA
jgi:flagellar hook-length control protein FliK